MTTARKAESSCVREMWRHENKNSCESEDFVGLLIKLLF